MIEEIETWRQIADFPWYDVSDWGRVRSWYRYVGKPRYAVRAETPRILKASPGKKGYAQVGLFKDGKLYNKFVHILVLEAFVGPCPDGMQTRHFPDGTKTNNNISNLSWGTPQENSDDKRVHGTMELTLSALRGAKKGTVNHVRGGRHVHARLSDGSVILIKMLLSLPDEDRPTQKDLGEVFRVPQQRISKISSGKCWAHV